MLKRNMEFKTFQKTILAITETQENADILERVFISLYREMGKAEYNMASGKIYENDEKKMAEIKAKHKNGVTKEIINEWINNL